MREAQGHRPPEARTQHAVDGIVAGARGARGLGKARLKATWILMSRGSEPLEEFFLDSPFGIGSRHQGEDPVPWICRAVKADGTVRLGAVDFEVDRFVSEVLQSRGEGSGL